MSQPTESPSPVPVPESSEPARVLAFERPRSDLQRAVQERAQEALERDRLRAQHKPSRIGRLLLFAVALIPVTMLFYAIDRILFLFHTVNASYANESPVAEQPAPVMTNQPTLQALPSDPGVVLVQPVPERSAQPPPPDEVAKPSGSVAEPTP